MEVTLITATGESKGKVELPQSIFGEEPSLRTLQEVITAYRGNQRRGTSDTKTRAEVSGGGHKPWRQKGTGNARSGSNRSPLWRKGGIIFGPHPRSYRRDLDEAKRRLALTTALSVKASDVAVLESLPEGEGKTGALGKIFGKAVPEGRILVVVDKRSDLLRRSIRNIARVSLADTRELNAWMLMLAPKVLITKAALDALEARLPREGSSPARAAAEAPAEEAPKKRAPAKPMTTTKKKKTDA